MADIEPAQHWANTWQRAWEELDTDAIVALYADNALLSTEPFREPYLGRDGVRAYIDAVFGEEENPAVHVGDPIVDGNRAAVSWWASLRENAVGITLAGTSILQFNEDGLVTEQWDAWNTIEEQRRPPTDWGPFL